MAGSAKEAAAAASKRRRVLCMIHSCDPPQRYITCQPCPARPCAPPEPSASSMERTAQSALDATAAQGDKGPREEAMRRLLQSSLVLCALALALPAAAQVEAP